MEKTRKDRISSHLISVPTSNAIDFYRNSLRFLRALPACPCRVSLQNLCVRPRTISSLIFHGVGMLARDLDDVGLVKIGKVGLIRRVTLKHATLSEDLHLLWDRKATGAGGRCASLLLRRALSPGPIGMAGISRSEPVELGTICHTLHLLLLLPGKL